MATYLQLGHDSWNLLDELDIFSGLVVSPVNDPPESVIKRLGKLQKRKANLEVVFDPQLYNPRTSKGYLRDWQYLPSYYDSVLSENSSSWKDLVTGLVESAKRVGADSVCSPAFVPKNFTDDYYRLNADIIDISANECGVNGLDILGTAIVRLQDLASPGRPQEIASILSSTSVDRLYLIFFDPKPPREHFDDYQALRGAVQLVESLSAVMRLQVAFCGYDAVLWKASGAQDITSGKFLNLRRFSPGRWDEEDGKGRVVPYWTDAQLVTLLRDADVSRLDNASLLDMSLIANNPYSVQILDIIRSGIKKPWVALSWRQYLYWISLIDRSISDRSQAISYLSRSDESWGRIQEKRILLIDRFNDGNWVRSWLGALEDA